MPLSTQFRHRTGQRPCGPTKLVAGKKSRCDKQEISFATITNSVSSSATSWDDKNFQIILRKYLDLKKNVDPKKELKRRAKNVGMRLIKIYKEKGVSLDAITQKVKSLGPRVKIRPKIRAKIWGAKVSKNGKVLRTSHQTMIAAELAARRSAKGFSSTGWFPAVKKLGGVPKRAERAGTGPQRGSLVEKLGSGEMSETLINQQPGAGGVMDKNDALIQKALDDETKDMTDYIVKKLNEAARKNGL